MFQIILSNTIHCLKYLRSATFGLKDTLLDNQSLWQKFISKKTQKRSKMANFRATAKLLVGKGAREAHNKSS